MQFTQIKETCLYVRDLERSKNFYHEKLGLPLISQVENRHIFFRVGTSVLLCFMNEAVQLEGHLPHHFAFGHIHLAFEVNREDFQAWKEKLGELQIEIIHQEKWQEEYRSIYFRDPDGHLLEIVQKGMWD